MCKYPGRRGSARTACAVAVIVVVAVAAGVEAVADTGSAINFTSLFEYLVRHLSKVGYCGFDWRACVDDG